MNRKNQNINNIFYMYQNCLDSDQGLRQTIRGICLENERLCKEIFTIMQDIHEGEEQIPAACQKARGMIPKAKEGFMKLQELVPKSEYFKFNDQWRYTTQRYCYLIALIMVLEDGSLAQHKTIAEILGIDDTDTKEGFHVDIEDYLFGLLLVCSELARLVVNSASRGEYSRAVPASKFINELNMGFRLLNLKNDFLRKRYDALKYDVKKIEEVVFDLSIRGLLPRSHKSDAGDTPATTDDTAATATTSAASPAATTVSD